MIIRGVSEHIRQSEVLIESPREVLLSWGARDIPGVSRQGLEIWCVELPISNILNHIRPNAFEISSSSLTKPNQRFGPLFLVYSLVPCQKVRNFKLINPEKYQRRTKNFICRELGYLEGIILIFGGNHLDTWRTSS